MFVVDNHVHLGRVGEHVSEYIFNELRKNWGDRAFIYHGDPSPKGEKRDVGLDAVMDEAGIDVCCVMSGNWNRVLPPEQRPYSVGHDYVADVISKTPTRLIGIASADPIADPWGAAAEIERAVTQLGFRAVKLYPTYNHFDPRDERCYPIYKKAIELDIPIHFHTGWTPVCHADMELQRPMLWDEVGKKFPELKVVLCHMGNPWYEECMTVVARHNNFHADVSALGFYSPEKIYRIIHDFGCFNSFEKLLYGSENPFMTSLHKTIQNINEVADRVGGQRIKESDLELILGGNAIRLYKIDTSRMGRGKA